MAKRVHEEWTFSDSQIVSIPKEAEAGQPAKETCGKHGIGSACHYQWRSKCEWFV